MPSPTPFVIRYSEAIVEGWAARPLAFQPKGWMLEYRTALRSALAGLDATRGRVLRAQFASPEPRPCDVENVLVYNLGVSAFTHLRTREVVLSRAFVPPAPPEGDARLLVHHHRYDMAGDSGERPGGRVLAHLSDLALRRPITVEGVWHDVRTAGVVVESAHAGSLALSLTINCPDGGSPILGIVKVLVDGVISALHAHDGTQLDVVAARLGQRLGVPAREVASLLIANPAAVLGTRRLLWPFRDFVQWNPADDMLVDLHVASAPSPSWRLSGSLRSLTPGR